MFISLEGIDGSGKTTTARALSDIYGYDFVIKKKIEHSNSFVLDQYKKVLAINYPSELGENDHLMSADYWVYLQCLWYTLIFDIRIKPALEKGKTVIVDGWYYKFKSKIRFEIEDEHLLGKVFSMVPQPEKVILLDTDPEIALSRRKNYAFCEVGGHTGNELNNNNFLTFQSKVKNGILDQRDKNWSAIIVREEWSVEEVASEVNKLIKWKICI